jgi:type II secretory pathway pseudopilin PulG
MRTRLLALIRGRDGFGMVELLVAMVILNVGLLAILAAFNSGVLALDRASRVSTASALAERQLELYRGLRHTEIALASSEIPGGLDTAYTCDRALGAACPNATATLVGGSTCTGDPLPAQCDPTRPVTGPDGRAYRVDTYVVAAPVGARSVKRVTVVVRDAGDLTRSLARVASTFDASTG